MMGRGEESCQKNIKCSALQGQLKTKKKMETREEAVTTQKKKCKKMSSVKS